MTEPPSESNVQETVIWPGDCEIRTGAAEIVGLDATVNVFLTENAPTPALLVALTRY
jgi:hypothetical protein